MSRLQSFMARYIGSNVALAAMLFLIAAAANAQDSATKSAVPGRIDFDDANLPPAAVEVDLTQGMINDILNIGDAGIAGVAETLLNAKNGNEGTHLAAEKLAAVRQVVQLANTVVKEARVRIYQKMPEASAQTTELIARYDNQLKAGNWDNVVRIRDKDNTVRVSLLRDQGSVRGAFVVVTDGHDLVLANVVCQVSPESVKKLTSAAAAIGLDNGLAQVIQQKMQKVGKFSPAAAQAAAAAANPAPSATPAPPTPPTPPAPQQ